jgi:RNA exonuclease 1
MYSVLYTFFQTPVSGEEKKRQERISAAHAQNQTPVQYLLTIEQIIEDDYPVPSYLADVFRKREGWIETPQAAADARALLRSMRLTEMCMTTTDGKALTQVCLINFDTGKVVYDPLVNHLAQSPIISPGNFPQRSTP